mmetsp:Transcript_149195/g.212059  ORF Transcript_149195/g.212059 Transcript_149195/m.212059 type:complete len:267 (-) Transcript_149195:2-802(-)
MAELAIEEKSSACCSSASARFRSAAACASASAARCSIASSCWINSRALASPAVAPARKARWEETFARLVAFALSSIARRLKACAWSSASLCMASSFTTASAAEEAALPSSLAETCVMAKEEGEGVAGKSPRNCSSRPSGESCTGGCRCGRSCWLPTELDSTTVRLNSWLLSVPSPSKSSFANSCGLTRSKPCVAEKVSSSCWSTMPSLLRSKFRSICTTGWEVSLPSMASAVLKRKMDHAMRRAMGMASRRFATGSDHNLGEDGEG